MVKNNIMFRLVKQVSIALLTFAGSLDRISEAALSAVAWSWPWGSQVVVKKNDDKDDETKTLVKHIWYNCKNRFNSTPYNSYQKWNNGTCQCECKEYHNYKKDCSWNHNKCFYENSKYQKAIADTSVIMCNDSINVTDSVLINVTNTISISVTSTVSINSDDKKVRYKNGLLYSGHGFISDHISIYNRYHFPFLHKT